MRLRGRRLAIYLPVLVTIAVITAVGGAVIVEQQRKVDETTKADEIAETYIQDVYEFRSGIAAALDAAADAPPTELKRIVAEATASPPQLPPTSQDGELTSTAYRDAQRVQATLLDPYAELTVVLDEAIAAEPFIAAAEEVLAMRISDYVAEETLTSVEPMRNRVIPAFVGGLDTFEEVPVPPGQEELASAVESAVQYVINQSRLMVSFGDLGQDYSFTYSTQLEAAIEAVRIFDQQLQGRLTNAIDAVRP